MTRAELLADLAAKDFVALVGTPEPQGETGIPGLAYYKVKYIELKPGEVRVGSWRECYFMVYDEGAPGEVAVYLDREPTPAARPSEFMQFIQTTVDATPASFEGLMVHSVNEGHQSTIYSTLASDGAGGLKRVGYYWRKDVVGPLVISDFDVAHYAGP